MMRKILQQATIDALVQKIIDLADDNDLPIYSMVLNRRYDPTGDGKWEQITTDMRGNIKSVDARFIEGMPPTYVPALFVDLGFKPRETSRRAPVKVRERMLEIQDRIFDMDTSLLQFAKRAGLDIMTSFTFGPYRVEIHETWKNNPSYYIEDDYYDDEY